MRDGSSETFSIESRVRFPQTEPHWQLERERKVVQKKKARLLRTQHLCMVWNISTILPEDTLIFRSPKFPTIIFKSGPSIIFHAITCKIQLIYTLNYLPSPPPNSQKDRQTDRETDRQRDRQREQTASGSCPLPSSALFQWRSYAGSVNRLLDTGAVVIHMSVYRTSH